MWGYDLIGWDSVVAHEFGHVIGIPHPFDDPDIHQGDPFAFMYKPPDLMGYGCHDLPLEECHVLPAQKERSGL